MIALPQPAARRLWLRAQRLDCRSPFGGGPGATPAAIAHLGYVQIDTINVIERAHHHILFTRIPAYRREHLQRAQTVDKLVFEYWTHALAYIPTADFRFFVGAMRRHRRDPVTWFGSVSPADHRRVLRLIATQGPLSIRDIEDEKLVDRDHEWASRKPSRRALQLAFYNGQLTVSERAGGGMLKTYELTERHFGWDRLPPAAREAEIDDYLIQRALRCQGVVSVASICHLDRARRPAVGRRLEKMSRRGELLEVTVAGVERIKHWVRPATLEEPVVEPSLTHLLSPFDPLVIQRDRFEGFFGYRHSFEAYLPLHRRTLGYFALPVLVGDRVAAAIDLKADRVARRLELKQWTWIGKRSRADKLVIEDELDRFAGLQFEGAGTAPPDRDALIASGL